MISIHKSRIRKRIPRIRNGSIPVTLLVYLLLLSVSPRIFPTVQAKSEDRRHNHPLPVVPYKENTILDDGYSSKILGDLDAFVEGAVSYLIKISHTSQQDQKFPGRFTYQADLRKPLSKTLKNNYWNHHHQSNYNLLRHNGAIYALSQAHKRNAARFERNSPSSDAVKNQRESLQIQIEDTMRRAIGYLRDNALLPVPDHQDEWLAAWERNDANDPHSEPDQAKLGGAGLALIALGEMEKLQPKSVSFELELRKLGAFVESLQKDKSGGFVCKYKWGKGPYDNWVSLYYPGEAALGMVTLAELELELQQRKLRQSQPRRMVTSAQLELEHQHHGHDSSSNTDTEMNSYAQRWMLVAKKALLYLERLRRDQASEDIEPDHWALLATARLLPLLERQNQSLPANSRERKQADLEYRLVYQHGVRVAHSILADHTTKGLEKHEGCFTYDHRTCATATRLEGLLAAMTFVEDTELFFGPETDATELLRDRMDRDIELGISFLLRAQQKHNQNEMRGAVPGKWTGRAPRSQNGSNDDNSNSEDESNSEKESKDPDFSIAEVRVDYVQHSLSAVMAYEAYLLDKLDQEHNSKGFHEKVHEKFHKVAHHVKHHIEKAKASSVFMNYAIIAALGALITLAVCLAYQPFAYVPFPRLFLLAGHRRRRRVKRND